MTVTSISKDKIIFYLFSFLIGFYIANGTTVLFARVLGFSFSRIFILGAIYMLMFIVFEIPSGALADMLGRKTSIVLGCFTLALAAVATGGSSTYLQVFLSFFIWAFGFSLISGADEALLYDRLSDHALYAKALGRAHFFALLGTALAGILGPYLFSLNFRYAYLASAAPFAMGGVAMLFFQEHLVRKPFLLRDHLQQMKTGITIAYRNKYILWAMAMMSLLFAVWYNLSNSYQPFLVEIGFSLKAFSIILPVLFVMEALGGALSGKLYQSLGEGKLFFWGTVGIAVALGLAGLLAYKGSLALIFLYSLLLGILRPAISTYGNRHIESSHRATVISAQAMLATITAALTLFLFGFLTDQLGLSNLLMILGGLVLVSAVLLGVFRPKEA